MTIEFLEVYLPILVNILLCFLLVVLIILGIKAVVALDQFQKLVDDVSKKVKTLDKLFSIIDFTTNKIMGFSDKVVELINAAIDKLFHRKKPIDEDEEE